MNVLVIGAGLSGLAAAWRLREAGHQVSLIERGDPADGHPGLPADTLYSTDRHTIGWMNDLGLGEKLLPLRPVQLAQARRGKTSIIDPQHLLGVAGIPGVRRRDAARLVRWPRLMARYLPLLDPTAPERAADLDFRSVSDFAELYFGPSVLRRWVAPEAEDFYSGEAGELSRVAALLLWRARATGRRGAAYPGLPRQGLDPLFQSASQAIGIRHHGAALRVEGGGVAGFEIASDGLALPGGSLQADAVVVATSPAEAGRLGASILEAAERDFFSAVHERPGIVLTVELQRAPSGMPERVRIPVEEGFSAASVIFEPGLPGRRQDGVAGLATVRAREAFAASALQMPGDAVEKSLLGDLKILYPALVGSLGASRLLRSRAQTPAFDVGAYRALHRFRRVQEDRRRLGRRLYFAGDYLISPSIEGRVVSGFRAAADLIADAARPTPDR